MYCSTCGGGVAPGLSYCNHCGARLNPPGDGEHKPVELFPDSLIWAIVSVFVVGLGGTIGLMAVMKDARVFDPGQIIGLSFLSFVTMLAVEAVLIYMLLSRSRGREARETSKLHANNVRDLAAGNERALPESAPSVTEQTTRTLEPVYRDRQ